MPGMDTHDSVETTLLFFQRHNFNDLTLLYAHRSMAISSFPWMEGKRVEWTRGGACKRGHVSGPVAGGEFSVKLERPLFENTLVIPSLYGLISHIMLDVTN